MVFFFSFNILYIFIYIIYFSFLFILFFFYYYLIYYIIIYIRACAREGKKNKIQFILVFSKFIPILVIEINKH